MQFEEKNTSEVVKYTCPVQGNKLVSEGKGDSWERRMNTSPSVYVGNVSGKM